MRKLKLLTLILLLGTAVAAAAPRPESPVDRTAAAPDSMAAETSDIADAEPPLTAEPLPATDVAPVSEAPDGPTATTPAGDRAAGLTAIADGEQPQPAKTVNQRRAERGISSRTSLFVPKGQWVFGGTVSYSTHNNRDYDVLVIDDITSEGYTFKVSPMIGYALGNNSTLGVRFIYGRTLLKLDGANVSFGNGDSSTDLSVDYYYALRHSYSFAAVYRRYIPFGESKRFGIFTDIQLLFGGSQGKFAADSPIKGTFQRGFDFELGLSPGLIAFATNSMAVEVNVGMMGIGYSRVRPGTQPGDDRHAPPERHEFQSQPALHRAGHIVLPLKPHGNEEIPTFDAPRAGGTVGRGRRRRRRLGRRAQRLGLRRETPFPAYGQAHRPPHRP